MLYTLKFLQNRIKMEKYGRTKGKAEGFVNVYVLNSSIYLSRLKKRII